MTFVTIVPYDAEDNSLNSPSKNDPFDIQEIDNHKSWVIPSLHFYLFDDTPKRRESDGLMVEVKLVGNPCAPEQKEDALYKLLGLAETAHAWVENVTGDDVQCHVIDGETNAVAGYLDINVLSLPELVDENRIPRVALYFVRAYCQMLYPCVTLTADKTFSRRVGSSNVGIVFREEYDESFDEEEFDGIWGFISRLNKI